MADPIGITLHWNGKLSGSAAAQIDKGLLHGRSPEPGFFVGVGPTANVQIGIEVKIDLPRPRDQLTTRENPEFLRLRRELFDFIKASEA